MCRLSRHSHINGLDSSHMNVMRSAELCHALCNFNCPHFTAISATQLRCLKPKFHIQIERLVFSWRVELTNYICPVATLRQMTRADGHTFPRKFQGIGFWTAYPKLWFLGLNMQGVQNHVDHFCCVEMSQRKNLVSTKTSPSPLFPPQIIQYHYFQTLKMHRKGVFGRWK